MTEPRFNKIQLLTTIREYSEFEVVLSKMATELPMSNPLVDEDIRIHVSHKLRAEPRFKRWSIELIGDVEEALTKGAQGMYVFTLFQYHSMGRYRTY